MERFLNSVFGGIGVHWPSTVAHHWPLCQSASALRQSETSQHETPVLQQAMEPCAAVFGLCNGDAGDGYQSA